MGVRLTRKLFRLLLPLSLVTGCASTPDAPPVPVLPLAPAESRLIIFRPSHFISEGRVVSVRIDGVESCGLRNGKGYVKDVAPGVVDILAYTDDLRGTDKMSFTAAAGQTYFVKFSPNSGAMFAPSLLVELASGKPTGPFNISMAQPSDLGSIVPVGCRS